MELQNQRVFLSAKTTPPLCLELIEPKLPFFIPFPELRLSFGGSSPSLVTLPPCFGHVIFPLTFFLLLGRLRFFLLFGPHLALPELL
jgi:hypothetical protein